MEFSTRGWLRERCLNRSGRPLRRRPRRTAAGGFAEWGCRAGTYGLDGDYTFSVSVEVTIDRYGPEPLADGLPGQVDAPPIAEQVVRNLLDPLGAWTVFRISSN